MTSRVFITQQPRPNRRGWTPDFSSATQYGRLVFLFEADEVVWTSPQACTAHALRELQDFDQDKDFILWPQIGDPAALMVTIIALARMIPNVDRFRALFWERELAPDGSRDTRRGFYTPSTFHLPDFRTYIQR